MTFDFEQFFQRSGIEYIASGKNVKHGNINVHCPWCGAADPSQHLGINLTTGQWGCWRDTRHRGVHPERLLVALARITWEEAKALVDGGKATDVGFGTIKDRAAKLLAAAVEPPKSLGDAPRVKWEEGIRKIGTGHFDERFVSYLRHRGFHKPTRLIRRHSLRCALSGRWRHRLIFPFKMNGRLLGWTGRAIGLAEMRYVSYPSNEVVKQLLYGYDEALEGGRALAVVEGPLDRLKVHEYARKLEVKAVSTLGVNVSDAQVELLLRLAPRFDKVLVLGDGNALGQALRLTTRLPGCGASIVAPPAGVEDPGAMGRRQVAALFTSLL